VDLLNLLNLLDIVDIVDIVDLQSCHALPFSQQQGSLPPGAKSYAVPDAMIERSQ
jgi:hypothetical protein